MKPAIIWRNPNPKWHKQRWQTLERGVARSVYVVQELLVKGDKGHWSTACALEVVRGGRKPVLLAGLWGLPVSVSK